MAGSIDSQDLVDLDNLRRAVVAIALEPARLLQLNAGERLLARGLVDNFGQALDYAWRLLPDRQLFLRLDEAVDAVEVTAQEDDWIAPAFVESDVWKPAREAARLVAESRGWSLDVDPFDDLPTTMRQRRGKRSKPPKRKRA